MPILAVLTHIYFRRSRNDATPSTFAYKIQSTKKYFSMSHQDLVLQALGMDNYDNALDLMKQIADEFITEQENEDKLNKEIDTLLDGVDFSEPLSPMDQNDSAATQIEVS